LRYNKKVKIFILAESRTKLSPDNLKNLEIIEMTSGLSANTGNIEGSFVKANLTVTFAYPKLVHILYPASEFCGEVYVIDISIDDNYLKEIHRYLITPENLKLPERKKNSHKYNYGHVLIIGGSVGKTGAVIMTSKSANVSGAGLVTAVIPKSLDSILEQNLIEEMTVPVDEKNGLFGKKAKFEILDLIKNGKFSSVVIGMGMSVNENTIELIDKILKIKMPLVIDADGLNNLAIIDNFKAKLKKRKLPTVLTPHVGEMSRLTKIPTKEINDNLE